MGFRTQITERTSKGRAHSTASLFLPDEGTQIKTVMLYFRIYLRTRKDFAGHSAHPFFSDEGIQKKRDVLFDQLTVRMSRVDRQTIFF